MRQIRGFVGQSLAGHKSHRDAVFHFADKPIFLDGAQTGSFTATKSCWALIALWAAGGAGYGDVSDLTGSGAGAGGFVYKRIRLARGQTISWSIGPNGTGAGGSAAASTVTLPDGRVLTASGGGGGTNGPTGGRGGDATGGDINRKGGDGSGGSPNPGDPGPFGAPGGTSSANAGGGGGAPGMTDEAASFTGGQGANSGSAPGGTPGGGGGGFSSTSSWGVGGLGRLIIFFVRAS
jgi:hypothetical protein